MSFYLLKSTKDRQYVGDFLIDTNKIEQIGLSERDDDKQYIIKIYFDSEDTCVAVFNTLDEAKNVVKEMLKNKISDQDLNDWLPQLEDEDDKKRKELALKIKEMMA